MDLVFEERLSDAPSVARIWRSRSAAGGQFISVAATNWEMVFTRYQGKTHVTVRGPETKATVADFPAHGYEESEIFGIIFKVGTFMPWLPPGKVMDRNDLILNADLNRSFGLAGSSWEMPTFENADTFVNRLTHQAVVMHDPVVNAVLNGQTNELSLRSIQARFSRVTGLTPNLIFQIERARQALLLLRQGASILDTTYELGYYDQPHLTRSLKRFLGQTPAQVVQAASPQSII